MPVPLKKGSVKARLVEQPVKIQIPDFEES